MYSIAPYPDTGDEFIKYTGFLNYKQKNMRFVLNNENHLFNNGEENSFYYVEYENGRREFFSERGTLIGIVDRFGNTIIFKHSTFIDVAGERSFPITSIIDSVGREIIFEYETNLNTQGTFNGENVTVRVKENGAEVQKVIYTKGRKLVTGNELQLQLPVLASVTDQSGEKTYFEYEDGRALYQTWSDYPGARDQNYHALLKGVTYPNSKIEYDYQRVTRYIGEDQTLHQFRVFSRLDKAGPKTYNRFVYSYSGDYTGYPTYYPPYLQQNNRYSTTVIVQSDTSANNFRITRNFDGKGKLLSTEKQTASGEREFINNTAFDGRFELFPTQSVTSYYEAGDTDNSASKLYTEVSYTSEGHIQSQTEPLTLEQYNNPSLKQRYTTSYSYEPKYRLLTGKSYYQNETDSNPLYESYTYTAEGRLATEVNALGEAIVYTYSYFAPGLIWQVIAEKASGGRVVSKNVVNFGAETRYAYPTEEQQWMNISQPNQQIVSIKKSYDMGTGLLRTQADGNNKAIEYQYDNLGRPIKITYPITTNLNGSSYSEVEDIGYRNIVTGLLDSYNANTRVLQVNSIKTLTQLSSGSSKKIYTNSYFNGLGLLLLDEYWDEQQGAWISTHYHYDDQGRAIYMKDGGENTTSVGYDAWGQENLLVDTFGNRAITEYGLKARTATSYLIAADTGEALNYVRQSYDVKGKLTSATTYKDWPSQAKPINEFYRYNIMGNVTAYIDPNSNRNNEQVTTAYRYDALGRLISIKDALNQTTQYAYDGNGQISQVTVQAAGGSPQLLNSKAYNEIGLMTEKKDAASNRETVQYSRLGLPVTRTDRNGSTINFGYDERQRLNVTKITGVINQVKQSHEIRYSLSSDNPRDEITVVYRNEVMSASQTKLRIAWGEA